MAAETIAVFTKNRTNPAYEAARIGAERTAARLGVRAAHFVPDRPDDVEQQTALVDQAIAKRVQAAAFVPVHVTQLEGPVRKLMAAGVPVANMLNRMNVDGFVTFVGADDYKLGVAVAERLYRHLGGKGDVAILEGMPGAVTSRDRVRAFRDTAGKWPDVRIVATRCGEYQREPARRVMREMLDARMPLAGVLAANDEMALGAIDALVAVGRRMPVTGVNALPQAIEAIQAGTLLATADFDAMKISCIATEAAIRHLRGESVPAEIILPVQVVDRANCAPWAVPIGERECPRWSDVVGT